MQELIRRLEKSGFRGKTLTLKVKYADFTSVTRSMTANRILSTKDIILPAAKRLMSEVDLTGKGIRLIGLSVSNPPEESNTPQWVEGELDFKPWE